MLSRVKTLYNIVKIKIKRKNVRIDSGVLIDSKSDIGNNVYIGKCVTVKRSNIGDYSYIAEHTLLNRVVIGKYCSIGPYVKVAIGTHPTKDYISTHPAFYSKSAQKVLGYSFVESDMIDEYPGYDIDGEKKSIIIGNDVWIGTNATLIEGCIIGDGVIVGAGTVVRGKIPPYAIVIGNPATIIRYRFEEELICKLEEKKWWNWELSELIGRKEYFNNVELFLGDKDVENKKYH